MSQRTKDQDYPFEQPISVTTTEAELVIEGIQETGLLGVQIESLSYDEGKAGGATIQDLRFKLVPFEQGDLFGPQQYQTPYAAVIRSPSGAPVIRGNMLQFNRTILRPGEKLSIFYKSGATAGPTNVVLRLQRVKLFDAAKWKGMV